MYFFLFLITIIINTLCVNSLLTNLIFNTHNLEHLEIIKAPEPTTSVQFQRWGVQIQVYDAAIEIICVQRLTDFIVILKKNNQRESKQFYTDFFAENENIKLHLYVGVARNETALFFDISSLHENGNWLEPQKVLVGHRQDIKMHLQNIFFKSQVVANTTLIVLANAIRVLPTNTDFEAETNSIGLFCNVFQDKQLFFTKLYCTK